MGAACAVIVLSVLAAGVVRADTAAHPRPAALPVYDRVAGAEVTHVVTAGETLGAITARFGMKTPLAATLNHLADPHRLHIGQRLRLSNRHIVPGTLRDGIIINAGDLRLYWLHEGAVEGVPVGVGRLAWKTPPGRYTIARRRRDPVWHVPRSIQREMREHGEPVKKTVPPGPDNPLGKYWLQLSVPGYGIHGTNAPGSVGRYTTHGCIRLRPDDIERLYQAAPDGTAVEIVDEPIKLARLDGAAILLEVHHGVAGGSVESTADVLERLRASAVADLIDLAAAERVARDAWGIAIDVSRPR